MARQGIQEKPKPAMTKGSDDEFVNAGSKEGVEVNLDVEKQVLHIILNSIICVCILYVERNLSISINMACRCGASIISCRFQFPRTATANFIQVFFVCFVL